MSILLNLNRNYIHLTIRHLWIHSPRLQPPVFLLACFSICSQSNDGGIDGYGYHVDADDFRTTRVVIQCKRFNSNPVSEPDINQFLGAMNKYQADYGVFITNSRFTNKAREAAREGTPITLIDGNDLIRLVIKYELYITPVTTYVLDGFYTED